MRDPQLRAELAERGIFFPHMAILAEDGLNADGTPNGRPNQLAAWRRDYLVAADAHPHLVTPELRLAMDAQPGMVTTPNSGVPILFTSVVSPELIRVIFYPNRAAEIMGGDVQMGTWTDEVGYFPMIEAAGQVATYGDYSMNGSVDVNPNWVPRQPYYYQTFKRWGEKLLAKWGVAAINYAGEQDIGLAQVFAFFQNKSYFYGVTGLVNYGLLNDPSLPAAIAPTTKAAGGTAWTNALAKEMYADVLKLYTQLQTQMGGNIDMDTPMTLALSTTRAPLLATNSDFNVSVTQMIRQAFPNLTIKTAPQYTTGGGELMQLIVERYQGIQTAVPAYPEKYRAHAVVTEPSAWSQKVSAGTWGAIVRRPVAIAQMLGI